MPPFLPRKRLRSSSPESGPSKQQNLRGKKSKSLKPTPRKATLFDDLDAGAKTLEDTKAILQKIQATDDDDDESSLSSLSDDEFEDVPNTNRGPRDDATDEEDEDVEFEDVDTNIINKPSANIPTGDLELTLTKDTRISLTNTLGSKKGPSKIERGIRMATHQIHVQMLMWHNAIRNSWLCDKELQQILVGQLPETVLREIEKWRKDSGLQIKADDTPKSKGKGKGKDTKGKKVDVRSQRDWGEPAAKQEAGEVNMSRGDPLFRLLKLLMNYWKQRFRIITPGLRKVGYMSLHRLDQEHKSFQEGEHDVERHGERIVDIHEYRKCAKSMEGSRDVGAQFFTALLRGIGIESRMVASLQPVGFGWNKNEDAGERKDKKRTEATPADDTSNSESSEEEKPVPKPASKPAKKVNGKGRAASITKKPTKSATTNSELLQKFEPRGAKADKAKQVTAYIVGHSQDDLKAVQPKKKEVKEGEETLQSYKSSAEFVLERHLRREEAILDTAKHVKMFTVKAKGDNPTEEKVFLRKDVVSCKSLETWHKEGRAPMPGAIPRKRVPYRAATTNRKRELAEAELESGEKMLQGLYSRDQTDWIIPPPIENGVIPKNSYGNMDVYVQSMVPVGAVHIPRRGTKRICTRLGIDYAEAVTGFEFGARMAIPIITGVVVAEENLELVMEEWEKDEAERVRKEDEKKTKAAISMWRKMIMGLRIIERMTDEYGSHGGHEVDLVNPFNNRNKKEKEVGRDSNSEEQAIEMQQQDEEMAGGFFPKGHDEEEPDMHHSTSFFPVVASQEDADEDEGGGGFIVEDEERETSNETNETLSATSQRFQFIGDENTDTNPTSDDESEEEMKNKKPQAILPAPTPRTRGRPAGSTNKALPKIKPSDSNSKPRTPAKRAAPAPKASGKRKRIPDSEDEDDDDSSSSLSDIGMDDEEEDEDVAAPPKKSLAKKREPVAKRGVTTPAASTPPVRKTPRRNAKRVSETGTRSRYFEHVGDSEEDEDD
ncbi:hypothetical protein SS1G_14098 [Sclerotinia sclerotiorum 1980 UF-70]|uniref:Rad4 beta-hairpin domain-containing protein n=1 Tax=Sclerotinia sclerotiorum (strain ATCC 18683 / 1980 / Ss-1) TaxID=665079 RepID=A7F917_SCLS1|nr:hypothetical protein SS1G_14098 [Sclerotinia sclerotiorum 1980 UF-70]EDN99238.1 hypothetical protein SS1G_14098 [Sclerotinia sclerotiorum 1980 UF-70]